MIKKERPMDNLRACKPTMMDKGYGKVATEVQDNNKMSKKRRDDGETNYQIDPVTGQASTQKKLTKKEAEEYKRNNNTK